MELEAQMSGNLLLSNNSIIWSCVRPNRRSHAIIWKPTENLITSTGFAVLTPTNVPTSYLYQFTTTHEFVGYLTNNAKGAAYPAVTAKEFENADILIPPSLLLRQFDENVRPTIELMSSLERQNINLKQARDLLLPRLMNGEIGVTALSEL